MQARARARRALTLTLTPNPNPNPNPNPLLTQAPLQLLRAARPRAQRADVLGQLQPVEQQLEQQPAAVVHRAAPRRARQVVRPDRARRVDGDPA